MAIGAPDYFQYVKPSRSILAVGQTRYASLTSVVIAGDGGYVEMSITPAAGTDLTPAMVEVSCEASCIQTVEFYKGALMLHRGYFDIRKIYMYGELASYLIHDTESFKVRVINNDSSARRVNITIWGTVETVS